MAKVIAGDGMRVGIVREGCEFPSSCVALSVSDAERLAELLREAVREVV